MTGGRGYIGLAAMIFGRWHPVGALMAALVFGFTDSLQQKLALLNTPIPSEFLAMAPYIATIIVVGLLGVRIALHQHLDPQRAQAIFAVLWCAVVLLMLVCECVRASRGLVAWTEAHSIGIVWGSGARAHTTRDPTR